VSEATATDRMGWLSNKQGLSTSVNNQLFDATAGKRFGHTCSRHATLRMLLFSRAVTDKGKSL